MAPLQEEVEGFQGEGESSKKFEEGGEEDQEVGNPALILVEEGAEED